MKNVEFINAGAGTGKTYTLTTKLFDLATRKENPVALSQVVMSTFTRAAAADLKLRAREKFLEKGRADLASAVESATIGTVHSVCERFIRKYWYLLGLSAKVEVITEENQEEYVNSTLVDAVTDDDLMAFHKYVELAEYKDHGKYNYDFWKGNVRNILERSEALDIRDLGRSAISLSHWGVKW